MTRILFLLTFIPAIALADTLRVEMWLTASLPLNRPLFSDSGDANALLDASDIPWESLRPAANKPIPGIPHTSGIWETAPGDAQWPRPSYGAQPALGYAAVYVTTAFDRAVKMHAACPQPFALYVDRKEIGRAVNPDDTGTYRMSETVPLARGKSLLLSKALLRPDSVPMFYVTQPMYRLTLSVVDENGSTSFTTEPTRALRRYEDVTLFDDVSAPVFSLDGRYLACLRGSYGGTTKKESWLEVWDLQRMNSAYTLRPVKSIGNVTFAPSRSGLMFYTTSGEKGSDIWSHSLFTGETQCLKRGVEGLVKLACTRGDPVLYYTADAEAEENKNDWTLYDDLEDRLSDFTRTRALFALNTESGVTERITALGDSFAIDEFALAPDRDVLLFTRRVPKLERPYFETEFWTYSPAIGEARQALSKPIPFETRPLSLTWLPGGEEIAFVSAAYFTEETDTLDRNTTQTTLWLLNVHTGELRHLTENSVFSINEDEERGAVRWNENDQTLWFTATVGGRNELLRIDPLAAKPAAERIEVSRPYTQEFDLSAFGTCAFIASGPQEPPALFVRLSGSERETQQGLGHRQTGPEILVADPNETLRQEVELASVEPWSFVNEDGNTIEGWLYYPPEYKPELSRSWPLIVYFYGGVSPRDLSWRYTYHWWCANGYVVYVLNPSGCVGYGPEFADKHSNDWGTLASRDIIDGVNKLLAEKPFLDGDHVGAYGGSYGGFLTMDLAVKTDLFAALASLSGISNIASYFGGGTWGFTYGDIALPRSFPWNRRDVFVEKSPVFHADQVKTPLLLSHGAADVNVPVGESDQMFTALKLLGKDVAYVQFAGEDHGFAKFENRVAEMEILREWFDKYLKNEPEAWDARWRK